MIGVAEFSDDDGAPGEVDPEAEFISHATTASSCPPAARFGHQLARRALTRLTPQLPSRRGDRSPRPGASRRGVPWGGDEREIAGDDGRSEPTAFALLLALVLAPPLPAPLLLRPLAPQEQC
mgnify:CR=1 FL=1